VRETQDFLDSVDAKYRAFEHEADLLDFVAERIAEGSVVGWSHGRMEFGPRALGARSILADARDAKMQSAMNLKIKHRESFRPFAPCVLKERAHEIFDIGATIESPYMLLVATVRERYRTRLTEQQQVALHSTDLNERINVVRSAYPAITHVDYSARIQTVDEARHDRFYRLLKTFETKTGCPLLVNTSFNVRGEPIVNTPAEAYSCFRNTEMDVLVLGDFVLLQHEQPVLAKPDQLQYLQRFELD
jgi:carbamoyltransferase